jgi:hypothetical protein
MKLIHDHGLLGPMVKQVLAHVHLLMKSNAVLLRKEKIFSCSIFFSIDCILMILAGYRMKFDLT